MASLRGVRTFGLANYNGPGHCATCEHPRRAIIDAHLVNETESLRTLSKRYSISSAALWKHRTNHLGIAHARTGRLVKRQRGEV